MYGIFSNNEPFIPIVNDGKIYYEDFGKIVIDFNKYFTICEEGLKEIEIELFSEKYSNTQHLN